MRGLSIIAVVSDQPARPGVTLLQPAVKEPCLTLPMDIRAKAYRIVAVQLAVAAVMALGLWVFYGAAPARSALVGGLISAAGSLLFARWLAKAAGGSPRAFARAFYVGEGLKIVLTVALFWVAIALLEANLAPLFITYAVTLMVYWLALLPETSGAWPQQRQ